MISACCICWVSVQSWARVLCISWIWGPSVSKRSIYIFSTRFLSCSLAVRSVALRWASSRPFAFASVMRSNSPLSLLTRPCIRSRFCWKDTASAWRAAIWRSAFCLTSWNSFREFLCISFCDCHSALAILNSSASSSGTFSMASSWAESWIAASSACLACRLACCTFCRRRSSFPPADAMLFASFSMSFFAVFILVRCSFRSRFCFVRSSVSLASAVAIEVFRVEVGDCWNPGAGSGATTVSAVGACIVLILALNSIDSSRVLTNSQS